MSKNSVIIIVSIFLILILGVSFLTFVFKFNDSPTEVKDEVPLNDVLYSNEESNTKDLGATRYLNFTVYREDGTEVNLSEYENNPVVILFFNDNNNDSLEVLGKFDSFYADYKDKINFLMINTNQEVNESLKDKYVMEIYYDFYGEAVKNYNIKEFPAMIYIDKTNTIINSKTGIPSLDAIEANLDILSENF